MSEKAAIDAALQANKDHQYALKAYVEELESELRTVDKMIEAVDSDDDSDSVPDNRLVYVDGAVKPVSMLLPRVLLSEDSPFYEDAQRRKRYEEFTTVNQMKTKEQEALREAIRTENMRMQTLEAQSRNQPIDVKAFPPEHFEQNAEGLDWRRVAVKMSSSISMPRTPGECKIRWLGHLHPSINHAPWTPEETQRLQDILVEDGAEKSTRNWVDIAKGLGTNRTPIDCMRHGLPPRVHTWSPEADRKLLEAVELFGQNNWQLVAMNVSEDATAHQCQKRYLDSLDPSIKDGPWTTEEEEQLRRAIAAFTGPPVVEEGTSTSRKQTIPWQDVALFVPGRTNNQCREHYQDCFAKSKNKGKSKSVGRSAKGKEKEIATKDLNDGEKDSGSDVSEHAEEVSTSIMSKRHSKPAANACSTTKATNEDHVANVPEEGPGGSHSTQFTPRTRPRPRPRKKARNIKEPPAVEEPVPQPNTTAEQSEPEPNVEASGSTSRPDSGARPKKKTMRRSSRKCVSKLQWTRPASTVNDSVIDGPVGEGLDEPEEPAADVSPDHKRRKTVTRRGKGKETGLSPGASLRTKPRAAEEAAPSGSLTIAPEPIGAANDGRRRSSRLLKAKS